MQSRLRQASHQQWDMFLRFQRDFTGTLMATRRARARGLGVNLGGGFHHAGPEAGGGFCMFNDIAAIQLMDLQPVLDLTDDQVVKLEQLTLDSSV